MNETVSEAEARKRAKDMGNEKPYEFDPNGTYKEVVYSEAWKEGRPPEYKKYREDWDRVPREKVELQFPIHLDIETTNICNLLCPMCPRTIMVEQDEFSDLGRMTKAEYRNIIDEAVQYPEFKSIKLNYLGEPLVHKDVSWQVEYAKQAGVVDVMMNSNATALTKKVGEGLLNAGLDNLFVSFDAANPKDYEIQRAGTTLGRVIDNVYQFVKLRDEINPSCQIRISMVMYKDPYWLEQFEAIKVIWKDLVDAVGYGFFVEREPNKMGEYPEVRDFHCAQPYQRMFLKYNGNVTICCVDDKDETIVGNWRNDKLTDVWNGPLYKEIRELHSSGRYYEMEMCRKCYLPVSD
ncbi:MAG: hypothetical protein GKS01_05630 [Alphaproteobacteria bacterium]|nr:hypothetical protein [Alphaproteobacteria bacterium]